MSDYSDRRYLGSKKTVDDRALNKDVLARLERVLEQRRGSSLRVLEIGGGLGTMVARLVERGVLQQAEYELVDADADILGAGPVWLADWARGRGYVVETEDASVRLRGPELDVAVRFLPSEVSRYAGTESTGPLADLLVANAFLDLVDVPAVLPPLLGKIAPGGLAWLTINYDGETIFMPEHPDDDAFLRVYDRTMDERIRFGRQAGSSRTGRRMFEHLARAGATVLEAGASDWIVYAREGRYEGDEAYFLHHIVHTIDEALAVRPEIDKPALARWVDLRHEQARRGELVYIAHQLDFLASVDTTR